MGQQEHRKEGTGSEPGRPIETQVALRLWKCVCGGGSGMACPGDRPARVVLGLILVPHPAQEQAKNEKTKCITESMKVGLMPSDLANRLKKLRLRGSAGGAGPALFFVND